MLPFPAGWPQIVGSNVVSAFPPDLGARIRYYERLAPQPSFAVIVARMLASDPSFVPAQIGEMQRVVSLEGEYGAYVAIDGRRDGSAAMKFVGALFLDEFATAVDVLCVIPDRYTEVRYLALELLRHDKLHLDRRPRRFFYNPPPNWHALPSGMTANWYPLDFPNNRTNIVVPPAFLVDGDGVREVEATIEQAVAGISLVSTAREDITTPNGARGVLVHHQGTRLVGNGRADHHVAAFVTGGRLYTMRLETANTAHLAQLRDVFRGVVESFRPLPGAEERRTGQPFHVASNAFAHWAN
ncbi:MAG: hypothetical protein ACKV2T_31000 [Kofleriaceae bacterium]